MDEDAVDHDWETVWNARLECLAEAFGEPDDTVLHAPVPFHLGPKVGGAPDLLRFSRFGAGKLYVTAELTGPGSEQPPNPAGQYELAIVHHDEERWGPNLIAQLAHYTMESVLDDGETMDIGPAVPEGSTIAGFLFRRIASFDVLGEAANVMCCVGITAGELAYKMKHGTPALLDKLGSDFLVTDLNRASRV
jgi:hypothetical protein